MTSETFTLFEYNIDIDSYIKGLTMIKGLFDIDFRLGKIDKNGDPLVNLNKLVR